MEHVECVKENILPIRQGRRANVMFAAMQNADEIQQQRSYFENQLRIYTGDDPLSIWLNYITWTEQNYITGGRESNLRELTQKCLYSVKDMAIYKNDPRILKVWLKFAHSSPEPLEIFNYMYYNNICCKLAQFYVHWSSALEDSGNVKSANATLEDGIKLRAEPSEILHSAIKELDERSINSIMQCSEPLASEFGTEQRSAFNRLKPQGKKHMAPFSRVGDVIEDKSEWPSTLGHAQPQPKKSISNAESVPFKVFNGESKARPLPVSSENESSYILNSSKNKENFQLPEKWHKIKSKKWMRQLPQVTSEEQRFTFHCDDVQPPAVTPKKLADGFNVLSTKKNNGSGSSVAQALFEPLNPMIRPMYNKAMVYGGAEEFSFEEIRAAKYFQERKNKEIERELMQKEDTKDPIRENVFPPPYHGAAVFQDLDSPANFGEGKHQADSASPSSIGMTADIGNMMRTLDTAAKNNDENPIHITKYAPDGATQREDVTPVSSQQISGTGPNAIVVRSNYIGPQSLDMNQPFQIFCDTEKEKKRLSLDLELGVKSHSTQSGDIPDSSHDVENVPPSSGYLSEPLPVDTAGKSSPHKSSFEEQKKRENDDTIVAPPNTEHFMKNAFAASTPYPNSRSNLSVEDENRYHNIPAMFVPSRSIIKNEVSKSTGEDFVHGQQTSDNAQVGSGLVLRHEIKETGVASSFSQNASASTTSAYTSEQLSTIPETSHEYQCNKSSFIDNAMLEKVQLMINANKSFAKSRRCPFSFAPDSPPNPAPGTIPETSHGYQCNKSSFNNNAMLEKLQQMRKSNTSFGKSERCPFSFAPDSPPNPAPGQDNKANLEGNYESCCPITLSSVDPFDPDIQTFLLSKIDVPLTSKAEFFVVSRSIRNVKPGNTISFGDYQYIVSEYLGRGSFAVVYAAHLKEDSFSSLAGSQQKKCHVALKVAHRQSEWEFYICSELHRRLSLESCTGIDVTDSVMKTDAAILYRDGIVIQSEMCEHGTLVDFINRYRNRQGSVPELLVMFLTNEMLHIMTQVHKTGFIHGDVKADNFLIAKIPSFDDVMAGLWTSTQCLRLIDFGRGIDQHLFAPGTAFKHALGVFGYGQTEELQDRPFIFQHDWLGIAGTIHALLFAEHMILNKNSDGLFEPKRRFKRYWYTEELWQPLFSSLVNLPLSTEPPDVTRYQNFIAEKLQCPDFELQLWDFQLCYKK